MTKERFHIHVINTGSRIKEKLTQIGMSKAELSRLLGMNQSNLNKLLSRYSIETTKLVEISKAVKYNFFQDFFMESEYIDNLYKDEGFYISDISIGSVIDNKIKELGLTQKEVAERISEVQHSLVETLPPFVKDDKAFEHTFRQQYVSTISKRSSIDVLLLCYISWALRYNFFECFCEKTSDRESATQGQFIPWEAYKKEQLLFLEIGELKNTINVLRRIIRSAALTEEKLQEMGISENEIHIADINADDFELIPETPLTMHLAVKK